MPAGWPTHEHPYLDKPELLEFPTETWAAQDMRKSEVFLHAARHGEAGHRQRFLDKARMFSGASLDWLARFPTRSFARPLVLLLSNGFMFAAVESGKELTAAPRGPALTNPGVPERFEPQKVIALRRAKALAVLMAAAALALAASILLVLL